MELPSLFMLVLLCRIELCTGENKDGYDELITVADMKKFMVETSASLRYYQQKTESLQNIVTKQEREIQVLKTDLSRLTSGKCDDMRNIDKGGIKRVAELNNQTVGVAFYAQLSTDQSTFGTHQTVLFDQVRTNIGNAYNHDDGVFTAPSAGVYVFFWTTTNRDRTHMQTELVINGVQYGRAWADSGNHDDVSMASNTVVVSLVQGDTVWIRSDTIHSGFTNGQNFATFSGWLLH